jgi:hypothetical protein
MVKMSTDVAMQIVGVGFIIGVLQDSFETTLKLTFIPGISLKGLKLPIKNFIQRNQSGGAFL